MNRSTCNLFVLLLTVALPACSSAPPPPDNPDSSRVRIPTIQDRAQKSPLEGEVVKGIEGVVTRVSEGRTPGFWMQDPTGDGHDATSEAIFVSTEGLTIEVGTGDAVSVSGRVEERGREGSLTTTQIVSSEVVVRSNGNDLPEPVFVGRKGRPIPPDITPQEWKRFDPRRAAIDFWESLEGMRVEIRDPVVVGGTSRYGDMVVVPDTGLGVRIRSPRGGVVIQEGTFNPERIVLDFRFAGPAPKMNVGDRFDGAVVGILDYNFGNFRLLVTGDLPEIVRESIPPEVTRLKGDSERLTIATYNVLNLSASDDEQKLDAVALTITENLQAPDILALEEIQDDSGSTDDGVVSAAMTFEKLIAAIVKAGGARYDFRQIDPLDKADGGQPGGNIRVGLLFNPARVTFVDRGRAGPEDATSIEGKSIDAELTLSPGRVNPGSPCFKGDGEGELAEPTRKSLAAELRFNDRRVFVIANHWKSKRGDDALFGSAQPPKPATEEQRICQAETIGRFAARILEADANAAVVVLGDMNEHEFRPPMKKLEEVSGLTNLIDRVVVADRYTYNYEGNSQILDHILVSDSLLKGAEIDIVHVNTDLAATDAASDHDPVLARLRLR